MQFMRGNDNEDELSEILLGMSLKAEPVSANPIFENKN